MISHVIHIKWDKVAAGAGQAAVQKLPDVHMHVDELSCKTNLSTTPKLWQ